MSNSDITSRSDIIKKYNLQYLRDKEVMEFMEWFTGEDGADKDIVQAREQAVEAYPALAYRIYISYDIRYAVEKKKPLVPALAKYFNVDKKAIKRLQGKTRHDLKLSERDFMFLDCILKLREKNFQQLKNNFADLNILENYASCLYHMPLNGFIDYLSLKSNNLGQYIEKMKEHSIHDVLDAFEFLQTRLFYPAILNKVKNHAEKNNLIWFWSVSSFMQSRKILIKHTNIKAILDFSERYHRNLFRWEDMFNFNSEMKDISWEPMFGKIDLGNGWIAREIHSIATLKEQGRRENHCVGGYAGSILKRDDDSARLIFSLEKNGEVKSTIDMICTKDKDRLDVKIQQNRAHSNENPCQEVLGFSDIFVEKIKNNCFLNTYLDSTSFLAENLLIKSEPISKLNIYLDNLKHAQKEYQKYQTENYYLSKCGYNPWDRDILENVWDEFKPVLPTKIRRLDLDEFIEMMPIEITNFRHRKKDDAPYPWDEIKNTEPVPIELDGVDAEMIV